MKLTSKKSYYEKTIHIITYAMLFRAGVGTEKPLL